MNSNQKNNQIYRPDKIGIKLKKNCQEMKKGPVLCDSWISYCMWCQYAIQARLNRSYSTSDPVFHWYVWQSSRGHQRTQPLHPCGRSKRSSWLFELGLPPSTLVTGEWTSRQKLFVASSLLSVTLLYKWTNKSLFKKKKTVSDNNRIIYTKS